MSPKKANEAQFFFFCSGKPAETFEVTSFNGRDEISNPYSFTVMLISSQADIAADDMINTQATLYVYRDGEYCPYSGIIEEFEFVDRNVDHSTYRAVIVPKLSLLDLTVQTRIFQKKNAVQIVKDVLQGANLSSYADWKVDNGKYPELEYVVQYQESDLNFISRMLETFGMWYFFEESPVLREELDGTCGNESMVITDKPASFAFINDPSDILYRSDSGMAEGQDREFKESINLLQQKKQVIPRDVTLKDYNYRTPEVELKGQKPISSGNVGSVYEYGAHVKTISEAQNMAGVAAGRIATRQIVFEGTSDCRGFRAGKRFSLNEHFRNDFNGKYVLTAVYHAGAHAAAEGSAQLFTYHNRFRCIPSAQADLFRPEKRAGLPRINGIMTGLIETNGSNYAAIDDQGRYKLRMPFDISGSSNMEGSRYVRLAQPCSGSNYGLHFPSHEGTEMIWACVDGDPDRPLGLGTVPNANTLSPVVSGNKQQNMIRTAGGNEILLDDTDGKQKVRIITKGKHTIEMADEKKYLMLQTTAKNGLLLDDQNKKTVWNADKHTMTMEYGNNKDIIIATGDGHVIKIDDSNKRITISTKAGHQIDMDDNGKKITLKDCAGKNTVTLDGNGGLKFDSQGKIDITAQQDLTIKAANVKITANAAFEAKATSDLKLKGMNLEAKADMNAKLEGGMNADVKAGMQCNVKGMMLSCSGDTTAEYKGGAMTTVKGGIVMIN
jgi:type VI secretion system secreted protein VgrG